MTSIIYCRVPEGQGLHQTARPPGRDETRSVNTHKAFMTDVVVVVVVVGLCWRAHLADMRQYNRIELCQKKAWWG